MAGKIVLFILLASIICGPAARSSEDKTSQVKKENQGIQKQDIGPYRKDLLMRIAASWHPGKVGETMTVDLKVGKDGKLLECKMIQSSGNKAEDEKAIKDIKNTILAPLPAWYPAKTADFRIDLSKVERRGESKSGRNP